MEATDTRSALHRYVVPALLRHVFRGDDVTGAGPEAAHVFGLRVLAALHALGVPLRERGTHAYLPGLRTTLFGLDVASPLGVAAGLDKHGECVDALFGLSPAIGLVEVGCVTPEPQAGNERPRLFRLPTSEGLINRYGFNSDGADAVARRLRARVRRYARQHGLSEADVLADPRVPASLCEGRVLAVQIGKNRATPADDMAAVRRDYVACVAKLGVYADVIVVNVSSPNTPGLRRLQDAAPLSDLLRSVVAATDAVPRTRKPRVVVKVSPDSDSPQAVRDICAAVASAGIAGVIVANTTVQRPAALTASPQTSAAERRVVALESGGYSGPALLPRTLRLVAAFRHQLPAAVDVVACGGVVSAADARQCVAHGASGVLAYTAFVYGGVGWFGRVAAGLAA